MIEVKTLCSKALTAVKGHMTSMSTPITAVVIGYMVLLILLILSYYAAWAYNCYKGNIVLADLLNIIREVTGTSMIAAVTFIAGCFVDMDQDGIPDKFENGSDKK